MDNTGVARIMKKNKPSKYPQNILYDTNKMFYMTDSTEVAASTVGNVNSLIDSCSDFMRNIIISYYKENTPIDEIADENNISKNKVFSGIDRFRTKLQKALETIIQDDEVCIKIYLISVIQGLTRMTLTDLNEIDKFTARIDKDAHPVNSSTRITLRYYMEDNYLSDYNLSALENIKNEVMLINIYVSTFKKEISRAFNKPVIDYKYGQELNGKKDACAFIINNLEIIKDYQTPPNEVSPLKSIPISTETLNVSHRCINAILRSGVTNLYELSLKSRSSLLKTRSMGAKSFRELEEAVKEYGIIFK